MPRLAVAVSGEGTILETLFAAHLPISLVLADRPCMALERVNGRAPAICVRRRDFGPSFDRRAYTGLFISVLQAFQVDVLVCAGFMTIFHPLIFERYGGMMLNTHSSLLPAFPGARSVRDVLAAGVTETGCTVHKMIAAVDGGEILAQEKVPVYPEIDTEALLHERIKRVERRLYPEVIWRFLREHFPN